MRPASLLGVGGTRFAPPDDAVQMIAVAGSAFAMIKFVGIHRESAMKGGVKRGVGDVRQGPGGTVANQRAFHWAAIAEKENVGWLQQNCVHGVNQCSGFSRSVRYAKATVWQRPITARTRVSGSCGRDFR